MNLEDELFDAVEGSSAETESWESVGAAFPSIWDRGEVVGEGRKVNHLRAQSAHTLSKEWSTTVFPVS